MQNTNDVIKKTKGYKRVWAYLYSLEFDPIFQEKIFKLRDKHQKEITKILYTAEYNMKLFGTKENSADEINISQKLKTDMSKITQDIGLDYTWENVLLYYVIANTFQNVASYGQPFLICDNLTETNLKKKKERSDSLNNTYPLAIYITPYSSQQDIVDFIKKTYKKLIKPIQNKYKKDGVTIGKVRKQRVLDRNLLICSYARHKFSYQKIAQFINGFYPNPKKPFGYDDVAKVVAKCKNGGRMEIK
jgi:hypothetical protein